MRTTFIAYVILNITSVHALAQKIETQKADRERIVHVQTALNHLTVIEVGEPVTTVAAGSSAFRIEWRENKVFIQPTEPNVATNLFIWTTSGRLNYELEPAGSVEAMHFAIDQPSPQPPVVRPTAAPAANQPKAPTDVILSSRTIRMNSFKEQKNRVIVLLKDVFQQNNQLFIRYAVQNGTKEAYEPGKPQVFVMDVPTLVGLPRERDYQLTEDETKRLKSTDQKSVEISDVQLRSPRVEPGKGTVGVVGVKLPAAKSDSPTVLRLLFPADANGPISATLVL